MMLSGEIADSDGRAIGLTKFIDEFLSGTLKALESISQTSPLTGTT